MPTSRGQMTHSGISCPENSNGHLYTQPWKTTENNRNECWVFFPPILFFYRILHVLCTYAYCRCYHFLWKTNAVSSEGKYISGGRGADYFSGYFLDLMSLLNPWAWWATQDYSRVMGTPSLTAASTHKGHRIIPFVRPLAHHPLPGLPGRLLRLYRHWAYLSLSWMGYRSRPSPYLPAVPDQTNESTNYSRVTRLGRVMVKARADQGSGRHYSGGHGDWGRHSTSSLEWKLKKMIYSFQLKTFSFI